MMRFISGTIVGAVVAASMTCVSSTSAQADDVIVTPPTSAVDVSDAVIPAAPEASSSARSADGSDLVAELPARSTDDFGLVGVTWDQGFDSTGLLVEVRLRKDGTWGTWEELHIEVDDGDEGGQDGTEPLWVGEADGVAVRVTSPTGQRPAGLKVSTIDPGTTATEASASTASTALYTGTASTVTAAASALTPPQPSIILRSTWGAAPNTKCDSPTTVSASRGAVVHHTAGTNDYTPAESASIVRATQAYHMKSRNWCDLGYNFLVDKYGQIFEGRNGGIDKQVRAAHSGNAEVNTYAMGVSMMGTFSTVAPTEATKDAVARLIAWRFGAMSIPATGTYSLGGKTLNRISGHRDVVGTECPGAAAYAWLGAPGGLRDSVSSYLAGSSTEIAKRASKLGAGKTGPLVTAEYAFHSAPGGTKARFQKLDFISSPLGTFWLADVVRTRYNALRAQSGVLGVPTSVLSSTRRVQMKMQRFHHGTIYRVKRKNKPTTAIALYGTIENKYRSLREGTGKLGIPTKNQKNLSGGRQRAWFSKGTLTMHKSGRVTVSVK